MNLDDIGIRHGADKSSMRHHYLDLYALLFHRYHNKPVSLLEIGIQFGCSIRLWKDYFTDAFILGMDAIDNKMEGLESDRCRLYFMDAYTYKAVMTASNHRPFEIIIDDGSHTPEHQQFVVRHYSHLLSPDGILMVEDVLSPDTIPLLKEQLPEGFSYAAVDMTEGLHGLDPLADSRLFFVWRK